MIEYMEMPLPDGKKVILDVDVDSPMTLKVSVELLDSMSAMEVFGLGQMIAQAMWRFRSEP